MFRNKIKGEITKLVPNGNEIYVSLADDISHGDYSSNIALTASKKLGGKPIEFAEELKKKLEKSNVINKFVSKIEIAGPGFLNFFLKKEFIQDSVKDILKKDFGKLNIGKGVKVNIEFISANPTGPIHIGNGRGAFLGDTLVKVLKCAGYHAESEFYINDAKVSEQIKTLGLAVQGKSDKYPYAQEDVRAGDTKLYKEVQSLPIEEAGYKVATQFYQKKNREMIEKKLKIVFDNYVSENAFYKDEIDKIISKNLKKLEKYLYPKDGAIWFESKKFGDMKDRVFLRSEGRGPTYALSDTLYHWDKFRNRKFEKAIVILGSDHHGYGPRIYAAIEALGFHREQLQIIFTQFIRLVKDGKKVQLSKRKGEFETIEALVDLVGLDSARFFFLMHSPDTHMDFDLELAKEQSKKNPVYYVQYAHARACSILEKGGKTKKGDLSLLNNEKELALIKKMLHLPELVADIAKDYQVHHLTRYIYELAQVFTGFYENCRVIDEKNKELTQARLLLVQATQKVLKFTLKDLMGIEAPQKM